MDLRSNLWGTAFKLGPSRQQTVEMDYGTDLQKRAEKGKSVKMVFFLDFRF